MRQLWNWNRPFLKCPCQDLGLAKKPGYKACNAGAGVLWYDQAIWFMMNNLQLFWPKLPTLQLRWNAFLLFMNLKTNKDIAKAHMGFMFIREWMLKACRQLIRNPTQPILTELGDAAVAKYIEMLFKPASFTEEQLRLEYQQKNTQRPSYKRTRDASGLEKVRMSGKRGKDEHTFVPFGRGHNFFTPRGRPPPTPSLLREQSPHSTSTSLTTSTGVTTESTAGPSNTSATVSSSRTLRRFDVTFGGRDLSNEW